MRQYHRYFSIRGCRKKNYPHRSFPTSVHIRRNAYPRIEATHIPIRQAATVDDALLNHCIPRLCGLVFVYPVWLKPMVVRNHPEFNLSWGEHCNTSCSMIGQGLSSAPRDKMYPLLEFIRERFLIQQDVRVLIPSIEPILDIPYTPHRSTEVRISGQNDERSICAVIGDGEFISCRRMCREFIREIVGVGSW